jgi:hypothetical protein
MAALPGRYVENSSPRRGAGIKDPISWGWAQQPVVGGGMQWAYCSKQSDSPPPSITEPSSVELTHVAHADDADHSLRHGVGSADAPACGTSAKM